MTERFTEKVSGRNMVSNGIYGMIGKRGRYFVGEAIDKLAEYETPEEEGRLVVLPCRVGDVVYVIDEAECLSIRKTTIEGITINERGICFMIPTKKANMSFGYNVSDFRKVVFFSKEQAEKALKEMENKE